MPLVITFQVELFVQQPINFPCCLIMSFSVLILCQIRAGTNDVFDVFGRFVANPTKWSFTGLVNTTLD